MPNDIIDEQAANLCHNIAWLRRHYGLTKKEMALTLGLGVRGLSMIENGVIPKNMSVVHLDIIARLSGTSIRSLFGERLGED